MRWVVCSEVAFALKLHLASYGMGLGDLTTVYISNVEHFAWKLISN